MVDRARTLRRSRASEPAARTMGSRSDSPSPAPTHQPPSPASAAARTNCLANDFIAFVPSFGNQTLTELTQHGRSGRNRSQLISDTRFSERTINTKAPCCDDSQITGPFVSRCPSIRHESRAMARLLADQRQLARGYYRKVQDFAKVAGNVSFFQHATGKGIVVCHAMPRHHIISLICEPMVKPKTLSRLESDDHRMTPECQPLIGRILFSQHISDLIVNEE